MSVANTARAPYNDDNAYGPVEITLGQAGEDDSPNLNCDDSDPDLGVICTDLPFGDCCQGENDELFDSADNNQADGWTSFGVYSGSNDDHFRQVITSTRDLRYLAGGPSGLTITGASVEGSEDDGGDEGGDDPPVGGEMTRKEKKMKRAVRASLYTCRNADGILYHIPINSPLGETYRKLVSRDEKRQFLAKNGVPDPHARKGKKRMSLRPV